MSSTLRVRFRFGVAIVSATLAMLGTSAVFAASFTSASDAALIGALVQDFDSEATGDFTTRSFLIGADGFSIEGFEGDVQIDGAWCSNFGTSGNCLSTNSAGGVNDDFDVIFTGAGVSAFGFDVTALDADWTIETYDAADVLLGTYTLASQSPALTGNARRGYFGVTETEAIKSFTVRSTGDDWALLDNLAYRVVPEPGTAVLLGLGLGLMALTRRRPDGTGRTLD